MASSVACRQGPARAAFWLIELSAAIVIIGVLSVFGMPRLRHHVERGKAHESFVYLASVAAAQERYRDCQGTYTADLDLLDMERTPPTYFTVGKIGSCGGRGLVDNWSLTLTRCGASSAYGGYTVTFTQLGFNPASSSIDPDLHPAERRIGH
jgi:type II secretory pathway pseudopilin PulG